MIVLNNKTIITNNSIINNIKKKYYYLINIFHWIDNYLKFIIEIIINIRKMITSKFNLNKKKIYFIKLLIYILYFFYKNLL